MADRTAKRALDDIRVDELSIVDLPANEEPFAIVKNAAPEPTPAPAPDTTKAEPPAPPAPEPDPKPADAGDKPGCFGMNGEPLDGLDCASCPFGGDCLAATPEEKRKPKAPAKTDEPEPTPAPEPTTKAVGTPAHDALLAEKLGMISGVAAQIASMAPDATPEGLAKLRSQVDALGDLTWSVRNLPVEAMALSKRYTEALGKNDAKGALAVVGEAIAKVTGTDPTIVAAPAPAPTPAAEPEPVKKNAAARLDAALGKIEAVMTKRGATQFGEIAGLLDKRLEDDPDAVDLRAALEEVREVVKSLEGVPDLSSLFENLTKRADPAAVAAAEVADLRKRIERIEGAGLTKSTGGDPAPAPAPRSVWEGSPIG